VIAKVLIANRGEVALRINSTLQKMGIATVGIHTYSERSALHVQRISENYLLEDSVKSGYLDGQQIIAIALSSGCQAIHPGYGFLSESATFAQQCEDAGLIFIGPSAKAISAMGEKIAARACAIAAGVPVVPGVGEKGMSDEALLDACRGIAFPLLVKPSAGGGGKGLHVAHDADELREVIPVARREALSAFGDDTLLVEKYVERARHIEFQVVADKNGDALHLGERECSLQRRHQKIIEEAPAPNFSSAKRAKMGESAIALAQAIGYSNIGTIEFLVDADSPDTFYFMEMNTRLQVEHRVTEMITGLDLVECQVRLAAGESLAHVIPTVTFDGHAIEARIYAEDAFNEFLPTGGRVGKFAPAVIVDTVTDSAISDGVFVSSSFDPMLAKVCAWGLDRVSALALLTRALQRTVLLGVKTNIDFLIQLLNLDDIKKSRYHTKYIETLALEKPAPSSHVLAALAKFIAPPAAEGAWRQDGWRLGGSPSATIAGYINGSRYQISMGSVEVPSCDVLRDDDDYWIHSPDFGTWKISLTSDASKSVAALGSEIVSPMPGAVVAVRVSLEDHVMIGDPLLVIEAMKMEYVVRATRPGKVTVLHVQLGSSVRVGQLLVEVAEDV
jgi:acetyl-CoA/propionyl-CoA carboxylase biotin carboxyl carrier protein